MASYGRRRWLFRGRQWLNGEGPRPSIILESHVVARYWISKVSAAIEILHIVEVMLHIPFHLLPLNTLGFNHEVGENEWSYGTSEAQGSSPPTPARG